VTSPVRRAWILGIAAVLLGWGCIPIAAQAAQALLSVEVPPAKWKAVRLKNLPKDTAIGIKVESSGNIDVILIHQDELKRFPAAVNPQFQGSLEKKLSFSVSLPKAGDYFVILDNRRNTEARKVRVLIRAERGKKSESAPSPSGEGGGKKKETEI
jgi:hypothetical protein